MRLKYLLYLYYIDAFNHFKHGRCVNGLNMVNIIKMNYLYGEIYTSQYLGGIIGYQYFSESVRFFLCHVIWPDKFDENNVY